MYFVANQFVFPLEEGLKYGYCLHFEDMVVVLGGRKIFGHETGRSTCLPSLAHTLHLFQILMCCRSPIWAQLWMCQLAARLVSCRPRALYYPCTFGAWVSSGTDVHSSGWLLMDPYMPICLA